MRQILSLILIYLITEDVQLKDAIAFGNGNSLKISAKTDNNEPGQDKNALLPALEVGISEDHHHIQAGRTPSDDKLNTYISVRFRLCITHIFFDSLQSGCSICNLASAKICFHIRESKRMYTSTEKSIFPYR